MSQSSFLGRGRERPLEVCSCYHVPSSVGRSRAAVEKLHCELVKGMRPLNLHRGKFHCGWTVGLKRGRLLLLHFAIYVVIGGQSPVSNVQAILPKGLKLGTCTRAMRETGGFQRVFLICPLFPFLGAIISSRSFRGVVQVDCGNPRKGFREPRVLISHRQQQLRDCRQRVSGTRTSPQRHYYPLVGPRVLK
jgi:hypothetical protein